jgi:hypothetical protein
MKMRKRLKDYSLDQISNREKVSGQVLPINLAMMKQLNVL